VHNLLVFSEFSSSYSEVAAWFDDDGAMVPDTSRAERQEIPLFPYLACSVVPFESEVVGYQAFGADGNCRSDCSIWKPMLFTDLNRDNDEAG
jgi:hypothetical protein